MSKIRVQEIEHTGSSNANPAIALNANNNVTFDAGVTANSFTGSGVGLTGVTDATKLPLTGGTVTGSVTFEDAINANNVLYDNLDLRARLEKVRIEQRINLILALGGGFNITND